MTASALGDRPLPDASLPLTLAGRAPRRLLWTAPGFITLYLLLALLLVPIATWHGPDLPGAMSVLTVGVFFCDSCTALLLLVQFRESRARFLLPLVGAYLFTATMMVPQLLAFPGALMPQTQVLGNAQTAGWTWLFWHTGFPAGALLSIVLEAQAPGRTIPERDWFTPVATCAAAVIAGAALTGVSLLASQVLPPLLADGVLTAWNNALVSLALILAAIGTTVIWLMPSLRRNALLLWLAVALLTYVFDIALGTTGGARFTIGWYAGRTSSLVSSTMLLMLLLRQVSDAYRAMARSLRGALQSGRQHGAARRRSDAVLRGIVEAAPGLIYAKDAQGRMILANMAVLRLIGKSWSEIEGRTDAELLSNGTEAGMIMAHDRRITHQGRTEELEEVVRGEGDQMRVWLSTKAPLHDAAGTVIGLVGMSVEVTDRKRIEERMRQSQRIEAVGRLTAGVAHDFNNVLQALLGGIELAIDELAEQPEIRGDLEMALRAGKRGARLTSHLLSFSRQQVLRPTPVALGPLLAELSHILLRTLGRDIAVQVVLAPGLPPVLADAAHLDSALLNLALNARDAMPHGGTLTITAMAAQDRVAISVVDTGEGMPAGVLSQACEPFFTTKGLKGSGLGLSMVQGFARQSGGELHISSVVGEGTKIKITLPVAVGYAAGGPVAASPVIRGAGRVLVVDDEPDVLRVTTSFLRKKGFEVTAAANAMAALAVLADGPAFDLLVADHALPGMTGADLVMAARSEYRGLPALIITGHAAMDELERLPADVVILRKPFERDELVRTAKILIDAARGAESIS